MKKRNIMALAAAVAVVVLLAGLGYWLRESRTATEQPPEPSVPEVSVPQIPEAEEGHAEEKDPVPPAEEPQPQEETPAPPAYEDQEFPLAVPDSALQIRMIRSYDGVYLEDGSDEEITGVAAILVENTGKTGVDLAQIRLNGSQCAYDFKVTGLAAGASVIVLEAGRQAYVEQFYDGVTADVAQAETFEMSEKFLTVEDTEDGQLQITNRTDQEIPCVRVFYKFYMGDHHLYVGGITYTAKITDLKAGTSVRVRPSHYAPGQSRVIMAKMYETEQE